MSIVTRADQHNADDTQAIAALHAALALQRRAHLADPYPSYERRVKDMHTVVAVVLGHRAQMKAALNEDFGGHPGAVGDLIEVLGMGARADYNIRHLQAWMAPEPREIDPALWGAATATVRPQPKGVIGNMVPWNFPFDLSFGPLLDMLAAGNRVILKPSDLGPACGELMAKMVAEMFDPAQVAVTVGGLQLAKTFPTLKWDHLMYTGSPAIGKQVMRAAAENLVPVTLELGGKSPTIVAPDAVDLRTVSSILGMKRLKSGQVCVAPDHVFVPRAQVAEFVSLARQVYRTQTPGYSASDDNTGLISARHFDRMQSMLAEARAAGCEVIDIEGGNASAPGRPRSMPLHLVLDPAPATALATEEIFGPILPVIAYDDMDAVIEHINQGERPLGLYVYTNDMALADSLLARTVSGGACVNTALLHGALASLPFGGSGNSGMGRHHAAEGFREFSNPRGVLVRGNAADMLDAFNPPYRTLEAIVDQGYAAATAATSASAAASD